MSVANRRDLVIGIDGDDRGLDAAFQRSEENARGLDRELSRLERRQMATQKATALAAAATDRFAGAQDKASIAAFKLGNEAKRAAEKAEKAEERAAAAAVAAAKGLLDESRAAWLAARADDAVERAAVKAAEAQLALAHAADKAAGQERQAARDAQLAGVAQRLGALQAAGAVREYNALLAQTKANHGKLAGTAVADFKQIGTATRGGTREVEGMADQFRELGAQWRLVGLVNGLAALPELASVAADAVTLGLGGAIAGVGLKFAAQDKRIRAEYAALGHDIFADLGRDAQPFVTVLDHVAKEGQDAFKSWEPEIRDAWSSMAPQVGKFVAAGLRSLDQLKPAFRSITRGFDAQLHALTPQLVGDVRNIGIGIKAIGDAAAANPEALTSLVHDLSLLVRIGGDAIGFLVRYKSAFDAAFMLNAGGGPLGLLRAVEGLGHLSSLLGITDRGFQTAGGSFLSFDQQAAGVADTTGKLGADMATLSDATATAADRANALNDAFTRLLNPAEAVFTDTGRLKQSIATLSAALSKSHGSLGANTAAARSARAAFGAMIDNAKSLASDLINDGKSADQVRNRLAPYIASMYRAAGANKQARALVDAFVRSLGAVPPKKGTHIVVSGIDSARAHIAALQRSITNLHGHTVTVDYIERVHRTLQAERARADGGIDRYADGGFRRTLDPFITRQPRVLMGETQTGGEAYIPLGASKRARSTGLLRQVAAEFGLDVVKRVPVAVPPAAPAASGHTRPAQVSQTFVIQAQDPAVIARQSAREAAWMLKG